MDWFSRTTSIAGIQVPNYWIFNGCRRYLDYLLIRRTLKTSLIPRLTRAAGSGGRAWMIKNSRTAHPTVSRGVAGSPVERFGLEPTVR